MLISFCPAMAELSGILNSANSSKINSAHGDTVPARTHITCLVEVPLFQVHFWWQTIQEIVCAPCTKGAVPQNENFIFRRVWDTDSNGESPRSMQ